MRKQVVSIHIKTSSRTDKVEGICEPANRYGCCIVVWLLLATFATHPWRWGHSGLRWRGCHNSAAPFYSCAAGFPPSL